MSFKRIFTVATLFGRLEAGIGASVISFRKSGADLATTASS
jgi:hypothetical protein